MLEALLQFGDFIVFLVLLALGYFVGRVFEAAHYRSIKRRERLYANVLVFSNRFPPPGSTGEARLVAGSVVVSEDYFKRVLAGLYSLLGGRMKSYESLLDRARREAVLRMKAEARRGVANAVIYNVKFQTFSIPGRSGKIGAVEILAYGTAVAAPAPTDG
jgi:uncharacterized protein YbjQ (UPF0145 family)